MVQFVDWKELFVGIVRSEQYLMPFDGEWKVSSGEELTMVAKTRRIIARARILSVKCLKKVDCMSRKARCEARSTGVSNVESESANYLQVTKSV